MSENVSLLEGICYKFYENYPQSKVLRTYTFLLTDY